MHVSFEGLRQFNAVSITTLSASHLSSDERELEIAREVISAIREKLNLTVGFLESDVVSPGNIHEDVFLSRLEGLSITSSLDGSLALDLRLLKETDVATPLLRHFVHLQVKLDEVSRGECLLVVLPESYRSLHLDALDVLAKADLLAPVMTVFYAEDESLSAILRPSTRMEGLTCVRCGDKHEIKPESITCAKHDPYYGYLSPHYSMERVELFQEAKGSSWDRFRSLLPIDYSAISFAEQPTPLLRLSRLGAKLGLQELFCKDESRNPTGSFKDRQIHVGINYAYAHGVRKIFAISSGNAAVSAAAYAQRGGVECECFTPAGISDGKRLQLELYGVSEARGNLHLIERNYEDVYRSVVDRPPEGWNITPGLNPFSDEGVKTMGYELFEQLGRLPDVVVVPCGNGALLYGLYKSFHELVTLGLATQSPRMIGVQVEGAAPLKMSYEQGREWVRWENDVYSVAEGILAWESFSSPKVMRALRHTGGSIVEVTDEEIRCALSDIVMLEAILPELTSVAAYAALKKVFASPREVVVVVQTAGGTKSLPELIELLKE